MSPYPSQLGELRAQRLSPTSDEPSLVVHVDVNCMSARGPGDRMQIVASMLSINQFAPESAASCCLRRSKAEGTIPSLGTYDVSAAWGRGGWYNFRCVSYYA